MVVIFSTHRGIEVVKILIAEDNKHLRRVLRVLLESREGWKICGEAENGREAVSMATQHHPDVILLDLVMPQMDGLAAAREISKMLPETPILMHTLFASTHLELEAKKHGVRRVIPKASGQTLVPAIEEALAQIPQREIVSPPSAAVPLSADSGVQSAAEQAPVTQNVPATQTAPTAFPAQFSPGRLLPSHDDWRAAFQAALREQDPTNIQQACEQARLLMNECTSELLKNGHAADSPDRMAVEDALRQLTIHEQRAVVPRNPENTKVN